MRIFTFSIMMILSVCLGFSQNRAYTVESVPNVHLQDRTRYVTNPDNILSAGTEREINSKIYNLEQQTGIEIVVVVLNSIGDTDCFDFSHKLLNTWGVGKKGKNNGMVVLLVTDQRCIHMYTGYGLEGILPDAICKRIQTKYMISHFKNKDWDTGMLAGMEQICSRLDGSMVNDELEKEEGLGLNVLILILGIFGLFGVIGMYQAYKEMKCPQCGKPKMMRTDSRVISRTRSAVKEEWTYTCANCGFTKNVIRNSYRDSGGGIPPIIGGFGGGSRGGGFRGGSFGGGIGGGGGAGSRF